MASKKTNSKIAINNNTNKLCSSSCSLELRRLNRTLRALGNSSSAINHASTEQDYLDSVCKIITDDCHYTMVWIGYAEQDEEKTVRPMAHAGFNQGYISTLNVRWDNSERGKGPTGTAIRTGKIKICRNMLTDPLFKPWRKAAIERGYASSLALPLIARKKTFGAITIYSKQPDPFSKLEIDLLSELSEDIANGIETLRLRDENLKKETDLESVAARYKALFDQLAEGFALHEIVCDKKGKPVDYRFLEINPAFEKLTGLRRSEVVGRLMSEVLPNDDPKWIKIYGKVALTGKQTTFENYSPVLKRHYNIISYRPAPNQFAVLFTDITEKKLRESQFLHLASFPENNPNPVIEIDREGQVIYTNKATYKALKRSKIDDVSEFLPNDFSEILSELQDIKKDKNVWREIQINDRYFNENIHLSLNPRVLRIYVSDITDRKNAELELQINIMKYAILFDSLPVGVTVTDNQGNIMESNEEAARILEESRESIMSRKIGHPKWRSIHSDGTVIKHNEFPSVIALKEKRIVSDFEMGMVKDNGKITWINVNSLPIHKVEDYGVLVTYNDITKRKETEYKLQYLQQELTAILENIDGGFIAIDENWNYIFLNKRAANNLFREPEDLVGKNIWKEFPKIVGTRIEANLRKVMESKKPLHFEDVGVETPRWYDNHIYPIPGGIALFWNEITARRKIEEENVQLLESLKEEDRRKDEFLAILGHELRNPLALMHAASELQRDNLARNEDLIKKQKLGLDNFFETSDTMHEQILVVSKLLNDLLDVSRITRGKIELEKELLDINELVRSSLKTIMPQFNESNHQVKTVLSDRPIDIFADRLRIEQIIKNILSNAAKYTTNGGEIKISTFAKNDNALISVKDSGFGISKKDLDKIFEPFFQLKNTQSHSRGGLGIGLMLSKQLAELHNGKIEVKSAGAGKGSEFVIWMPLVKESKKNQKKLSSKTVSRQKPKILLVDDNIRIVDLLGRLLVNLGFEVKKAYEGESAVKISKSMLPDVILLDIGLPGIDGFETAQLLRAQHKNNCPQMKIIAVSGYGTKEDKKKAIKSGFDFHMTKPISMDEIKKILNNVK